MKVFRAFSNKIPTKTLKTRGIERESGYELEDNMPNLIFLESLSVDEKPIIQPSLRKRFSSIQGPCFWPGMDRCTANALADTFWERNKLI